MKEYSKISRWKGMENSREKMVFMWDIGKKDSSMVKGKMCGTIRVFIKGLI